MATKNANIYRIANKCGFEVKHRVESENTVFAFKSKESDLNLFFEIVAKNDENEKKFIDNVSHEVFLFSENLDPHTETKKYLGKKGFGINKYTEIYSEINAIAWQIRKFWLSL